MLEVLHVLARKSDHVGVLISRNISRAIIIEFQPLEKVYQGAEKVAIFKELRAAQKAASTTIGQLINLAHRAFSGKFS